MEGYYGQRDVGVGAVRDAEARGVVNWGGDLMAPLTRRRARVRRGSGFLRERQREEEEEAADGWDRLGRGSHARVGATFRQCVGAVRLGSDDPQSSRARVVRMIPLNPGG